MVREDGDLALRGGHDEPLDIVPLEDGAFGGDDGQRERHRARLPPWRSRRLLDGLVDGADHVEGLLRQGVVLALEDLLEAADGLGDRDVLAGRAGELLGDEERLGEEALDAAGAGDGALSSSDSSSMPRMAMMSCRSL